MEKAFQCEVPHTARNSNAEEKHQREHARVLVHNVVWERGLHVAS